MNQNVYESTELSYKNHLTKMVATRNGIHECRNERHCIVE
jgi:hypothetical protein